MERHIHVHLSFAYEPRAARPLLVGALLLLGVSELASESVTLTTYYPAPSGVYNQMITTGNTYLARDGGTVGVGTRGTALDPSAILQGMSSAFVDRPIVVQKDRGVVFESRNGAGTPMFKISHTNNAGSYDWINLVGNDPTGQFSFMRVVESGPGWSPDRRREVGIGANDEIVINPVTGNIAMTGNARVSGNLSIAGAAPGTRPYVYINADGGSGSFCTMKNANGWTCANNEYITWMPGIYVDNGGWWYTGPNLNFSTVSTPLGNQTNIATTASNYYCCRK